MKNETYKGRKLRTVKGKEYGYVQAFVNGKSLGRYQGTEEYALQQMRSTIDHVETVEFARYGVEWYAPGTAAQCDECTASKAVNGPCLSPWCMGLLHAEALEINETYNKETPMTTVPRCCEHARMYHGGRGCDLCNCKTPRTIKEGPFTPRQERIIDYVTEGKRHKEIASLTGIGLSVVRQETITITHKMGATTSAQAVATYATAIAYRNAAAQVLSVRVPDPDNETEEHVNHVLEGIAKLFQDWAAQRLPK